MAGTSQREDEARKIQDQYGNMNQQLQGKVGFDYGDMSTKLNELLKLGRGDINRGNAEDIANFQKGSAGRFASQGIGGSMAEEAARAGAGAINKNKVGALSSLAQSGISQNMNLMDRDTQNLFRKYGLMGSNLGGMSANAQNFSDSTWLDSVFEGLNAAGGLIPGAGMGISALSSLFGKKKKGGIAPIDV